MGRLLAQALAASAAALLAAISARADPGLLGPWPEPDTVMAGIPVELASHSPFALVDIGAGGERDPPTQARAQLFLPPQAVPSEPAPAVILLHGANGILANRELRYARQLAGFGVAALVIDSFDPRRDRASSFVGRLVAITESMVLADAFAGLAYLDGLPEVDGTRVVLIGFSYGGMSATYAADASVAHRFAPDGPWFAGHVAYYAPCLARFAAPQPTGAPVLMMWGSDDAIVDPGRCAELAGDFAQGGAPVRTVEFAGAVHQWDGAHPGPRPIGRDISDCALRVEPDGRIRDLLTGLTMDSPLARQVILAACAEREPFLIGRDDAVRALSDAELSRFLAELFGMN